MALLNLRELLPVYSIVLGLPDLRQDFAVALFQPAVLLSPLAKAGDELQSADGGEDQP